MSAIGHVRGGSSDAPTLLQSFGIGVYNTPMAVQYAFMIPRTTDPDAPGVIMLVEAVQRGLQGLGANVNVSGILDQATVDVLRRVSGPNWHGKTWIQILGDLTDASARRTFRTATAGYAPAGGVSISTGSVALLAIGAFFLYKTLRS